MVRRLVTIARFWTVSAGHVGLMSKYMCLSVTIRVPACRGVGPRALSNGINSAVFFVFFEALRAAFARHKEQVGHSETTVVNSCVRGNCMSLTAWDRRQHHVGRCPLGLVTEACAG